MRPRHHLKDDAGLAVRRVQKIPSSRHSIGVAFHGFEGEIKDVGLGACRSGFI